ncbi:unnamed protein product [Rotaria socialis]|uniref:Cytochrome c peroxidase, mitochondrial n=2 Tax=Rotaria socialis TaxID=392032 RepID=A0A818V645_9BILA|nr:unnamed protein product [Rotaria socialis]CAF4238018.1 unnamed protein product [Rotaria socialis]CAF4320527.1 unnamed protein product [Rotaria socialis]CAF4548553.1 unnamed protein product [Rotaria socialis]
MIDGHDETGKVAAEKLYVPPEKTEIARPNEETDDERNMLSTYAEIKNGSSNMFDMARLDSNTEEILDQRQVTVELQDFENASPDTMNKSCRFLEVTMEKLNLTNTNTISYIREELSHMVGYADQPLLPLYEACAPLIGTIHNVSFYVQLALDETPKQPANGLTIDESASIRLYTIEWESPHQSLHSMLNYALNTAVRKELLFYFKYLKLLMTALVKLPCLPSQIVWRGINQDASAKFLPGTIMKWWAFSSCTSTMTALESNMRLNTADTRTLLSIEAINGRMISAHSHSVIEDEILLFPGTHVAVQSQMSTIPNLHIIHLKQIIPEDKQLELPFKDAYLYPKVKFTRSQWYQKKKFISLIGLLTAIFIVAVTVGAVLGSRSKQKSEVNYTEIRKSIGALLNDKSYDDGSYGPLFVRMAWHSSGTYSRLDSTGGSNGACMRFEPESVWGANKGLNIARERLEGVYQAYPGLTHADLYTLAGVVAIEKMGGPIIKWRYGRSDYTDGKKSPPDGRLPDASQGAQHIRDIFYRMGFNDSEIVALIGAHSLGRCHIDRSGYDGDWTTTTTTFSNEFFRFLSGEQWQEHHWNGSKQFEDVRTQSFLMLPTDMALIQDPEFKKYVVEYANDTNLFSKNFAAAFGKLLELGVDFKNNV